MEFFPPLPCIAMQLPDDAGNYLPSGSNEEEQPTVTSATNPARSSSEEAGLRLRQHQKSPARMGSPTSVEIQVKEESSTV